MEERGDIYVFSGPMFSGKTKHLVNALLEYDDYRALKPDMDDRYSMTEIVSHDGEKVDARAVPVDDIYYAVRDMDLSEVDALGIDESQFFGERIVDAVEYAADRGLDVYIAGLEKDFRREDFGSVPELIRKSDNYRELFSECAVCGDDAEYSQRMIEGKPARYDDPVVLVGAEESYEPRCGSHHVVRPPEDEETLEGYRRATGLSGS